MIPARMFALPFGSRCISSGTSVEATNWKAWPPIPARWFAATRRWYWACWVRAQLALPILKAMRVDPSDPVRQQASEAMWKLGDEEGLQDLLGLAMSRYIDDRQLAYIALAEPGDVRQSGRIFATASLETSRWARSFSAPGGRAGDGNARIG